VVLLQGTFTPSVIAHVGRTQAHVVGLVFRCAPNQPQMRALTVIMIKRFVGWLKARDESKKLENWFSVSWDTEYIYRNVAPPGKQPWSDKFRWSDIERICFDATDYMYSDDIYFFTSERPESYVIPTEAKGGEELWSLVLEKGLFDADLAIKAATSPEGMFCWPDPNS